MNFLRIGVCLLFFQIIVLVIKPYVYPLQILITKIVASILNLNYQGDTIFINNYILEVEPLCTGILMYFTLISLFFAFSDFKKAVIYSVLFIPIVFFINLIRIILTCIFTKYFGYFGVLIHDIYWICDGIITFVLFYITKEKINAK